LKWRIPGKWPAGPGAIETLSAATWTATKAPLPPGAATAAPSVGLDEITCPTLSNCIVVGVYQSQDGSYRALIETATAKHS
jgi:hypothetical protein